MTMKKNQRIIYYQERTGTIQEIREWDGHPIYTIQFDNGQVQDGVMSGVLPLELECPECGAKNLVVEDDYICKQCRAKMERSAPNAC
jgi:hypothetical protein